MHSLGRLSEILRPKLDDERPLAAINEANGIFRCHLFRPIQLEPWINHRVTSGLELHMERADALATVLQLNIGVLQSRK